jgi:hypothetical protein
MKLQLNKLMAGLVLAGSAVALVGCGGGDTPTLVVTSDAVIPVSASTVSSARSVVGAASSGVTFDLPALSFPAKTAGTTAAAAPAGSVLTLTTKTAPGDKEIAEFILTSGSTGKVTGVVLAGSCEFKVVTSNLPGWVVDQVYTQNPCSITLRVRNAAVGATGVSAPVVLTLGAAQLASKDPITVNVVGNSTGEAEIQLGDTTVVVKLPTGGSVK